VKEVRPHSERGKTAVPRVVETVATLSCCGMGVTVPVTSRVRTPCGGSLTDLVERRPAPEPWRGRARRNLRPRPRGSGERELAPKAEGIGRDGACARGRGDRARRCLRPRPRGSGETVSACEALRGRARRILCPRPWGVGRVVVGARALVIVVNLLCPLRFLLFWFGYPFLWYPTPLFSKKEP
jgi:hypothetical protein